MSHIQPGDEDLHFSDNSHRHTAGPGFGRAEDKFRARMLEHLAAHHACAGQETSAFRHRVRWSH